MPYASVYPLVTARAVARAFTYEVEEGVGKGAIVSAPFGRQRVRGIVVSVEDHAPDEGHRFDASGIPVVMDDLAFRTLQGAVLEVDPDPAGDGYRLNHPDAVLTTFC